MFRYSSTVRSPRSVFLAALAAGLLASSAWAVPEPPLNLEMVPVGNAGNAADTNGFGAVGYDYTIGKYDVTAGQYTTFLNAVASSGDPNGLYSTTMSTGYAACGITQTPDGLGGYSYSTANPNVPVNHVSFWNAARFVNWLQNGQPVGPQGPTTTEGGTYTITPDGIAANTIVRNPGALTSWVIASENEWYKAAYFDPSIAGGTGGYWQYPTRSNTAPGNSMVDNGNNANYYKNGYTNPPLYITAVGTFVNSPSAFGTFDQGGNVTQWNDTVIDNFRGIRGGSWGSTGVSLKSSGRDYTTPDYADGMIGFRVVFIPEPTSLSILVLGSAGLLTWRRRKA